MGQTTEIVQYKLHQSNICGLEDFRDSRAMDMNEVSTKSGMGAPKTVIVWGHEDLLGYSISLILDARKDWNVVRFSDEEDIQVLMAELEKCDPDVIIMHQTDCTEDMELPWTLVRKCRTKVITVSPESNSLEMLNSQKVIVKEAADLLSIIES